MIRTTDDLIQHLKTHYHPDELLVYTVYTKADAEVYLSEEADLPTVWQDVVKDFDGCFGTIQVILNKYIEELVSNWELENKGKNNA